MTGIQVYECDDFHEAVAEAVRLSTVFCRKFGKPRVYVVRKRRSAWPHDAQRRQWNTGHDRWRVLTSPNVPDRAPESIATTISERSQALVDFLAQHDLQVNPLPREIA